MQTGSAFCELRVSWLLVVGWIVAVAQQTAAADRTNKATSADKPNILFIMVDEMKWNVMSCAGHAIVRTPNLDRLAHEGTRFTTAYTVAPICTPSRYSFFTGRYAHVHGATDNSTWDRHRKGSRFRQAGWYQLSGCSSLFTSLVSFGGMVSFKG